VLCLTPVVELDYVEGSVSGVWSGFRPKQKSGTIWKHWAVQLDGT